MHHYTTLFYLANLCIVIIINFIFFFNVHLPIIIIYACDEAIYFVASEKNKNDKKYLWFRFII